MAKFTRSSLPGDYMHQKIWEQFNSYPGREDKVRCAVVKRTEDYEDWRNLIVSSQWTKVVAWYKRPKGYMALYEYTNCLVMFDILYCECDEDCLHGLQHAIVAVASKSLAAVENLFELMESAQLGDLQLSLFEEF